jgi:WD40 repeat protein
MQEYTDDHPITCARFSAERLEIYVVGERSIKIWDARTGKPVRVMKNVLDSDITVMEIDHHSRKIIVGSFQGELKIFDLISGVNTLTLDSHNPQDGEISFIGYGGNDHTVVTVGWDRVIKVHKDEIYDHSMPLDNCPVSNNQIDHLS